MSTNAEAAEIHLDIATENAGGEDALANAAIAQAFAILAVAEAIRDLVRVLTPPPPGPASEGWM